MYKPEELEIEEDKKLIDKYPWLLPRNVWTDKISDDYDYSYILIKDEIPSGWWKAFGELLCEDIQKELERCDYVKDFRILEAKEKYGGLRIYTGGLPKECKVWDIIEEYSALSENICCICGKLDVPFINNVGWVSPYCEDCFNKIYSKHLLITVDKWKECHEKQKPHKLSTVYKYRQYSKEKTQDFEIDISNIVQRIRDKNETN